MLDLDSGILRVKQQGEIFMKFGALSAGERVGDAQLRNKRIVAGLCMPHALGATFLLHMTPARSSARRAFFHTKIPGQRKYRATRAGPPSGTWRVTRHGPGTASSRGGCGG